MRPSPKAYKLEQELKSLPLDELERLLYRMGPKSPVGYPPNPNTVKQPEKKAILPHASSTMYTQKQTVDVKKSYDGYVEQAVRNGLKQPLVVDETNPHQWTSLYGSTFSKHERDSLELLTMANEKIKNTVDRDEFWGRKSNLSNIYTQGVDSVDRTLKEKISVFSRFRYNPLETLSRIFTDFDTMHSGIIAEDDFVLAVGMKLNYMEFSAELRALYRRHDLKHFGSLDSEEFISSLFNKEDDDPNFILGKYRECLELQTGGFYTFKKLLERCGEEDADGTGVLKPEFMKEMLQILAKIYRLDVSSSGYDRLFVGFSDKYGMVKYKSLVQAVRGFLNEPRMKVVQQAFDKFEKDKWGRVMMKTIEDRYDVTEHPKVVSGEMTKTEAEFEFYSKFDKRSDQPVAFDEFVDVYEWISANCNEDEAFKTMVRSPWHLKSDDVEVGCRRVLVWHTNGSQDIVTLGNDIPALATKELMIEKLKQDYGILDICDVTAI